MPDIKENIKEELLKLIHDELELAYQRSKLNMVAYHDNYDCGCEIRFLEKLIKFAESI